MTNAAADVRAEASRTRAPRVDASSLLELSGPRARVILFVFVAAHAVLAFALPDPLADPFLTLTSFVATVVAAVWVTVRMPDPFPLPWTWGVLALGTFISIVQSVQLSAGERPVFASWHTGAVTILLVMLALRDRAWLAWLGYLVMVVVSLAWAFSSGLPADAAVELVIRHAGSLLVGTLFGIGLRRLSRGLGQATQHRLEREAAEAAAAEAARERADQLDRLDRLAGSLLARVAAGEALNAQERRECLLVEASLRDQVRGRLLATPAVVEEARAARERGVTVTLLDDSSGATDAEGVPDLVAGQLAELDGGALTARLLPEGRELVASVVIELDEGRGRVIEVPAGSAP